MPILSAGHINLTSANFADTLRQAGTLVVAASSRSCHKCIRYEPEYKAATATLDEWGVSVCHGVSTGSHQRQGINSRNSRNCDIFAIHIAVQRFFCTFHKDQFAFGECIDCGEYLLRLFLATLFYNRCA